MNEKGYEIPNGPPPPTTAREALAALKAQEPVDAWRNKLYPTQDPLEAHRVRTERVKQIAELEAAAKAEQKESDAFEAARSKAAHARAKAVRDGAEAWGSKLYPTGPAGGEQ